MLIRKMIESGLALALAGALFLTGCAEKDAYGRSRVSLSALGDPVNWQWITPDNMPTGYSYKDNASGRYLQHNYYTAAGLPSGSAVASAGFAAPAFTYAPPANAGAPLAVTPPVAASPLAPAAPATPPSQPGAVEVDLSVLGGGTSVSGQPIPLTPPAAGAY